MDTVSRSDGITNYGWLIMYFNNALAVIIFLLLPQMSHAANVDADHTLQSIIDADFQGDGEARAGQILCGSNHIKAMPCKDESDIYSPISSNISIVSNWDFLGDTEGTSHGTVFSRVKFHVLARTVGKGTPALGIWAGRSIQILNPEIDEIVTYEMRRDGSQWKIVNPPAPRVGVEGLYSSIITSKSAYEKSLRLAMEMKKPTERIDNIKAIILWLSSQEAAILKMRASTVP